MKTFPLLLAVLLFATAAHASYLPPVCEDVTPEQRLAESDVAGTGEIVDTDVDCGLTSVTQDYTVKMLETSKGESGQTIQHENIYPLDYGMSIEECNFWHKKAEAEIGRQDFYYFKKTEDGFTMLLPKKCHRPGKKSKTD